MTGRPSGEPSEQPQGPAGFDDYELRLGDIMRGERATLGKSLLDVQREIKIKANYLAAIEDADLDAFETPGFIAGYIRAYSRYLGMNPDWAYKTFCEESGFSHVEGIQAQIHSKKPKPALGADKPLRNASGDDLFARSPIYAAPRESVWSGVNPGMLGSFAVLIALIFGLGYGGWSALREIQKVEIAPVESALGTTAPGAAEATGLIVEDNSGAPRLDRLDRLYRPEALDVPVLVARDRPISTLDPRELGVYGAAAPINSLAEAVAPPPVPTETIAATDFRSSVNAAIKEATAGEPGGVQVTAEAPPEVVLFAREPVWVRVRSADGTILLEKILDGGERYVLPQTEDAPILRAGNSGSLYFAVNGETLGPAGPGTSIAKNVSLGASELAAAYLPVDLSADPDLARLAELVVVPETPPIE